MSRGRTEISARALTRLATAVAAEELGADRPAVQLLDDAGRLGVAISSPIRLAAASSPAGAGLVDEIDGRRARIGERFGALSGRAVGRVGLSVTGLVPR